MILSSSLHDRAWFRSTVSISSALFMLSDLTLATVMFNMNIAITQFYRIVISTL